MTTHFRNVLQQQGWWIGAAPGKGPRQKCTHLLMDGGRAHVPDAANGEFLNQYALALVRGQRPSVVELRTPIYKLFMDLDILLEAEGAEAYDLTPLWHEVQAAVQDFFDAPSYEMVVCTAPTKKDGDGIKRGAHLYWPTIYVKDHLALAFREYLIPKLKESAFGDDAAFLKPWEEIVDIMVYKGSGLRMPWSSKGQEGRAYVPTAIWNGESFDPVPPVEGASALRSWVHKLSIRTVGSVTSPTPTKPDFVVQDPSALSAAGTGSSGTRQRLDEYQDVIPRISEVLPPEYAPCEFTSAFKTPYSVMLRTNCHFCRNVGRAHKSNTVFFVVSRLGLTQRCFDHESCKGYESDILHALDEETIEAFLGPATGTHTATQITASMSKVTALPSQKSLSSTRLNALLSLGVKSRAPTKKKQFGRR